MLSQIERARDYFVQWEAVAQQKDAPIYKGMGLIFLQLHRLDLSLSYLFQYIDALMTETTKKKRRASNHPSILKTYELIGDLFLQWNRDHLEQRSPMSWKQGQLDPCARYFETLVSRTAVTSRFRADELLEILVKIHWERNERARAQFLLGQLLDYQEKRPSSDRQPSTAASLVRSAMLCSLMNQMDQALALYRRASHIVVHHIKPKDLAEIHRIDDRIRRVLYPNVDNFLAVIE